MNEALKERRYALIGVLKGKIAPRDFIEIMERTSLDLNESELLKELKFHNVVLNIAGISFKADIAALETHDRVAT